MRGSPPLAPPLCVCGEIYLTLPYDERHLTDPHGTWGIRSRPAGGWSTRGRGPRGGDVPWGDSGPADESGGRDRRAPGETWSQLSEGVRVGLSRPLRVGSGHTSPPGVDPSRRQLDQRDLRRGGPRLPELDEEPAEGGGEPRTIERPRMRARFVDQGEPVRPPGEGRRHDPTPPPSLGETSAGQSTPSEAAVPVGGEAGAGPRPKKRHQKRLQRPSHDARLANKRANLGEPEGGRWNPETGC